MEFLKNLGRTMENVIGYVGEKSRKAAYLNRIRTVIKCEERAAEKEYLALGRYYYNNLRDKGNAVTEPHCAELEAIEARLDSALQQLEKFYSNEMAFQPAEREEVDLSDVQCLEGAPEEEGAACSAGAPEDTPVQEAVSQEGCVPPITAQESAAPAAPDENDGLPFEG